LPRPVVIKVGRRGFTGFYRGNVEARKLHDANGQPLIEVLTTGQSVLPPTVHPKTGRPYWWQTRHTLFNTRLTELSVITEADLDRMEKRLSRWCPPPRIFVPMPGIEVKPVSDQRMRSYADAVLRNEVIALSSTPRGGRNARLFRSVCKVGKFFWNGIMSEAEVINPLMEAAAASGLVEEDGPSQCLCTIRSGLRVSRQDVLPSLTDRPYRPGGEPSVAQ
jgi:hypothetical protein